MSFVKTGGFRGLSSDSDDIKIDSSGNVAFTNNNIVNKNLLINGGMNIFQRSTSAPSITATGYHAADRWKTSINTMGTWTQSQSTDVPSGQGFGYSLKIDCTTADGSPAASDYHSIVQRIEGQNIQHLLYGTSNAKSLTFSCWVKSNKTGVYTVEFYKYGTSTQRHIAKEITINTANTWEKKTVTISGDVTEGVNNDNAVALEVHIWLGAGTTFTSGTFNDSAWATVTNANRISSNQVNLADSTSNEFYTTGWQLEVGENASGFEFEPYETVLRKCQRYYFEQREGGIFGIANTTNVNFRVPLSVTMRVAPSASLGGSGFRIGDMISVGFFTTSPSIAVNYNGPTIAGVRVSGFGGLTAYRTYLLEPTATYTGYIKLDADL